MKIKIECDSIDQTKVNKTDKNIEITVVNPTIEEYEDMEISQIIDMIGLEETNEIINHLMNDYIAEIEDGELLKLSLKIAKEISDRGINIEESI